MDLILSQTGRLIQWFLAKQVLKFPLFYTLNVQKLGVWFQIVFLMYYYDNFNLGPCLYLSLHGTYGFMWFLKHKAFPDKTFAEPVSVITHIPTAIVLIFYSIMPIVLISGNGIQNPSNLRVCVCVTMSTIGQVIMMVTDCQKYFTLRLKQGLITDGMFALTRNPNYFGEIMIYSSFAICVGNVQLYVWLGVILFLLLGSMAYNKDQSFKKKEGWNEYVRRTWRILPKLVPSSDFATLLVYCPIVYGLFLVLSRIQQLSIKITLLLLLIVMLIITEC